MRGTLFLLYIFMEIVITLPLAYNIGAFYTFLEVVVSALAGIMILFNTHFKLQESFNKIITNRLSISTFSLSSTMRVFGSFLLILPGFFGDTIGVILLAWSTILLIGDKISHNEHKKQNEDKDIIDVEIVENSHSK